MNDLIQPLLLNRTAPEILREVRAHPEGKNVSRHQVYYFWKQANIQKWWRHSNSLTSADGLVSEDSRYYGATYTAGNMVGLCIYNLESIKFLADSTT